MKWKKRRGAYPSANAENEKEEHQYKDVEKFHELKFAGSNSDVSLSFRKPGK